MTVRKAVWIACDRLAFNVVKSYQFKDKELNRRPCSGSLARDKLEHRKEVDE